MLALGVGICVHHSGFVVGDMHDRHGMSAAIELCLGVMTAIGTAVMAIAFGVLALGRWRSTPALNPVGLGLQARAPDPRVRAGPPLLCLLCVSRR